MENRKVDVGTERYVSVTRNISLYPQLLSLSLLLLYDRLILSHRSLFKVFHFKVIENQITFVNKRCSLPNSLAVLACN